MNDPYKQKYDLLLNKVRQMRTKQCDYYIHKVSTAKPRMIELQKEVDSMVRDGVKVLDKQLRLL